MYNFRNYIKTGLLDAVGKMEDYQVILNSAGWLEKGVLQEEDLEELQMQIEKKNTPVEEETENTDVLQEEKIEAIEENEDIILKETIDENIV